MEYRLNTSSGRSTRTGPFSFLAWTRHGYHDNISFPASLAPRWDRPGKHEGRRNGEETLSPRPEAARLPWLWGRILDAGGEPSVLWTDVLQQTVSSESKRQHTSPGTARDGREGKSPGTRGQAGGVHCQGSGRSAAVRVS